MTYCDECKHFVQGGKNNLPLYQCELFDNKGIYTARNHFANTDSFTWDPPTCPNFSYKKEN